MIVLKKVTLLIIVVLVLVVLFYKFSPFSISPLKKYLSISRINNMQVEATGSSGLITHIIIMDKENRTFDSMFGSFPGANGATTYVDPNGVTHPLNHQPDTLLNDISHSWNSAALAYDNGKMDKFSQIQGAIQNNIDESDSQFYRSDIPNYWQYAQTFALPDNNFSFIAGPSFPNHLFTIAGEDQDVDANPKNPNVKQVPWGCDAPPGTTVEERPASGSTKYVFPCFDFQTLGDTMNQNNVSWKYYAPGPPDTGYGWSAFDAINHIRNTSQWTQHVVDYTQFATDAASGSLPAVSWLVEPGDVSDHPPHSICAGENWTVQQINAVMNNPTLWAHTAIILTWDDFGGFYDHVIPPRAFNQKITYGYRLPLIIISPYSRPGFIDHTLYSTASILKFVEDNFNLPALTTTDGTANDFVNSLDYTQTPLSPLVLQTRTCP